VIIASVYKGFKRIRIFRYSFHSFRCSLDFRIIRISQGRRAKSRAQFGKHKAACTVTSPVLRPGALHSQRFQLSIGDWRVCQGHKVLRRCHNGTLDVLIQGDSSRQRNEDATDLLPRGFTSGFAS
jgi:hypothetical protein